MRRDKGIQSFHQMSLPICGIICIAKGRTVYLIFLLSMGVADVPNNPEEVVLDDS